MFSLLACGKKDEKKEAKAGDTATKPTSVEVKAEVAPEAKAAEMKMVPLDIITDDLKATIDAPEGAVFEDSYGTIEVKLADGKDFFVALTVDGQTVDELKKEVAGNDVQKLIKYHTETEDTLVFETEAMGQRSVFFDSWHKVGDKSVHCGSGRGANRYTLAHAATYEAACKSLTAKE